MNAQSNHSSNDTSDPLFLGPEAGLQTAEEVQTFDLTATYSPDDNKCWRRPKTEPRLRVVPTQN